MIPRGTYGMSFVCLLLRDPKVQKLQTVRLG